MVLIVDVSSEHGAYIGRKLSISICERHLVTSKESFNAIFFRKRSILPHMCGTCSELPSYISTMDLPNWFRLKLGNDFQLNHDIRYVDFNFNYIYFSIIFSTRFKVTIFPQIETKHTTYFGNILYTNIRLNTLIIFAIHLFLIWFLHIFLYKRQTSIVQVNLVGILPSSRFYFLRT